MILLCLVLQVLDYPTVTDVECCSSLDRCRALQKPMWFCRSNPNLYKRSPLAVTYAVLLVQSLQDWETGCSISPLSLPRPEEWCWHRSSQDRWQEPQICPLLQIIIIIRKLFIQLRYATPVWGHVFLHDQSSLPSGTSRQFCIGSWRHSTSHGHVYAWCWFVTQFHNVQVTSLQVRQSLVTTRVSTWRLQLTADSNSVAVWGPWQLSSDDFEWSMQPLMHAAQL